MNSYRLPITLNAEYVCGLDPETTPPDQLHQAISGRCLLYCGSLFFAVQQLAAVATHDHWTYDRQRLIEALEHIGEIGIAAAAEASEHMQRLAHLATKAAPPA